MPRGIQRTVYKVLVCVERSLFLFSTFQSDGWTQFFFLTSSSGAMTCERIDWRVFSARNLPSGSYRLIDRCPPALPSSFISFTLMATRLAAGRTWRGKNTVRNRDTELRLIEISQGINTMQRERQARTTGNSRPKQKSNLSNASRPQGLRDAVATNTGQKQTDRKWTYRTGI